MKNKIIMMILLSFTTFNVLSLTTCSRAAFVNGQSVLIDSKSFKKGEGLRPFLDKDDNSRYLLNKYQKNASNMLPNIILGTMGSLSIIYGLTQHNKEVRETSVIVGSSLLLVNILLAKTLENYNEKNLIKAIEEYNKRNYPKILLSTKSFNDKNFLALELVKKWRF